MTVSFILQVVKKIEFRDMEKVNATLSNKVDGELLSNSISQLKNEIYESFGHYKNDLHQNRKYINIILGYLKRIFLKNSLLLIKILKNLMRKSLNIKIE